MSVRQPMTIGLLVFSVIFATLGFIAPISEYYEAARLFLLMVVSAIYLANLNSLHNLPRAVLAGLTIFVFSGALSFALFNSKLFAFADLFLYAIYFMAVLLLASKYSSSWAELWQRHFDKLLIVISVCISVYSYLTLIVYFLFLKDGGGNLAEYMPYGFINIRYWSHLASWFLPLIPVALWYFAETSKPRVLSWILLFTSSIWWWVLILSMARGSLFSIILSSALIISVSGKVGITYLKNLLKSALLGVLLWLMLSKLLVGWIFGVPLQFDDLNTTSSGRVDLWITAIKLSFDNFPLGIGPLGWISPDVGSRFGHPHNMILMWAAEWGWLAVVGLALILITTIGGIIKAWKWAGADNESTRIRKIGLTVSALSAFSHAQLSAVFISPFSMLVGFWILVFFFGMAWKPVVLERKLSYRLRSKSIGAYKHTEWMRRLALFSVGLFLIAGWYSVIEYYQYMEMMVSQDRAFLEIVPRFWLHGQVQ